MTNRYQREQQKQRRKKEQIRKEQQINNFPHENFNVFLMDMFNLCIKDLIKIAKETSNPEERQLILTLVTSGIKLIKMKTNEMKEVD
ncbi:hypothetical protein [Clostridium senegalense]|uniref:hypothetical protein n=1 Tax=Clostridium senegalense TaxID=1465809 RepID=UPI000288C52D|nr:hypothetical protein [Clostridium senegalense]